MDRPLAENMFLRARYLLEQLLAQPGVSKKAARITGTGKGVVGG